MMHRSMAVPPRVRELDWLMLAVVCLCCIGLVMAVSVQSARPGAEALGAMKGQGAKLAAGLVMLIAAAAVPLELLRRHAVLLFACGAAAVFGAALLGPERNGAQRWLSLGSVSLQPVDFARLTVILVTAAALGAGEERIRNFFGGFVRVLLPAAIVAGGLFLQPDNGNALLVLALAVAMAIAGGVALRWAMLAALPLVPLLIVVVSRHGYALDRVTRWWAEEPHYQVRQSLFAVELGGLTGTGLGAGWRKMGFVPEAHNDFVFAILGEELGFIGSATVVALYTLIGFVGWRLVLRLHDPFCRYVVFGCTVAICSQALINMLVTTGLAPAKGIDLPFVSAGGSNLVASLGAIGLIGNAARSDPVFHVR